MSDLTTLRQYLKAICLYIWRMVVYVSILDSLLVLCSEASSQTLMLKWEYTREAAVWGDRDTSALPDIPHTAESRQTALRAAGAAFHCLGCEAAAVCCKMCGLEQSGHRNGSDVRLMLLLRRPNWLFRHWSNSQIRSLQCAIIIGQYRIEKGSHYIAYSCLYQAVTWEQ